MSISDNVPGASSFRAAWCPMPSSSAFWLANALFLGVRHGIDWDHIAAITDIVSGSSLSAGAENTRRKRLAFTHSMMYALGHAMVVAVLGLAALMFSAVLPSWVDPLMQRLVGATLVALGIWVVYSLFRYARDGVEFRLKSRWMLIFDAMKNAIHRRRQSNSGADSALADATRSDETNAYGKTTAFGIGSLHGIGAETGTQVLLLAAIGGAATRALGFAMLVAFIIGLLISNGAIAVAAVAGSSFTDRIKRLYLALGALTAVFSFIVGIVFLCGHGDILPSLSAE